MATPILVPHLGSADQKLKVSLWLSRVGEQVLIGDRVVELLIPGITFDVEAPCSGTVVSCDCQPGAEVCEGSVLGWIDEMKPDPSEELE
ncbi:lipoyl domain-containing protein [Gimesia aquarii]|uniref:Branched-chain alpha-keto acid dehydrogenase subunit E2 n=1 Tax=Gimesia aquarii TaxID=2527964 RepID=A0A517VTT7_9PLAN|nr:lipoyl domain-containing protein [Gimesia aquarii]QDT96390.1 branched-chain alpha-keto acid dehydrogenase subunit E2 [Gimesia aquarii]